MKDCIIAVVSIIFVIALYLIEPESCIEVRNMLVETISNIDIKRIVIPFVIVIILLSKTNNLN